MLEKPSHLALYDVAARECLQEFDLESHGVNVIFSVFPAVSRPVDTPELVSPSAEVQHR
jgi:hypothetical protein